MAMGMLAAGGLPIVTDGIRGADDHNRRGYYELERVKDLDKPGDPVWLADARGKGIKIVSFLLTYLPESYDYRVIFMRRDLQEIIASQNQMLDGSGRDRGAGDARMRALYEEHLDRVQRFMARRRCFSTLMVDYPEVLAQPLAQAERLNAFVGGGLHPGRMAGVAEPTLHHNRVTPAT